MSTTQLPKEIFLKISGHKKLIIIIGIICALLFVVYAKITKPEYTSKATLFPLTNASDNALTSGTLSSLLGITESATKSFSNDASINIIELALSRNIREAVASERLPGEWKNKTVAELLIDEYNNTCSIFDKKIEPSKDSVTLAAQGGKLLLSSLTARLNRNGVLELNFTSTNEDLVTPVSNIVISKISLFYINLRVAKATLDYNFTLKKIDSIQKVLDNIDANAIQMQDKTMFTQGSKLLYAIPKSNLDAEKIETGHEREIAINNREEALWRLQKATPIIATLDKPTPPFDVTKPSGIVYGIIGFIIGIIIAIIVLISGLIYQYAKGEIYLSVFGDNSQPTDTSTVVSN